MFTCHIEPQIAILIPNERALACLRSHYDITCAIDSPYIAPSGITAIHGHSFERWIEACKCCRESTPPKLLDIALPSHNWQQMSGGLMVSALGHIVLALAPPGAAIIMDDATFYLDPDHMAALLNAIRASTDRQIILGVGHRELPRVRELLGGAAHYLDISALHGDLET